MNFDIKLDDVALRDYANNQAKQLIKNKVEEYFRSSAATNMITNVCRQELERLATETVMTEKIKELMDKKTMEILPNALNDKFAGAYMSVVISEARKQAAIAAQQFKASLAQD